MAIGIIATLRVQPGKEAEFEGVFAERRAHPREDLISGLVAAREQDEALTGDELFGICALLLVLCPYLVEVLSVESSPWLFTHGAAFGSAVLSELAGGVARRLAIASSWNELWIPFSMPLAAGGAAVAAGCVVFSARDFRG